MRLRRSRTGHADSGLRDRIRAFAWYPMLAVATAIIYLFVEIDVSPLVLFRPLVLAIVAVGVLELALGAMLRNGDRAGLAAMLLLAALITFGQPAGMLLLAALAAVVVALERLPVRRLPASALTVSFNTFAVLLLVVVLAGGVAAGRAQQAFRDLVPTALVQPTAAAAPADLPDIYLILMDGYARPDNLRERFGLDDTRFLDFLASEGFHTSLASQSNYPSTAMKLASMLNMRYLDDLPDLGERTSPNGQDPQSSGTLRDLINDNRVFRELRARDYQIVSIGSGFEQLSIRRADVYFDGGEVNSFEIELLTFTPGLTTLTDAVVPDLAGEQARARLNTSLATLARVSRTHASQPRLVLVHLLQPHPPAVFGRDGQPRPVRLGSAFWDSSPGYAQATQAYADEVMYLNGRMESVIEDLLEDQSGRAKVIVLMSDHGSRYGTADAPFARDTESVENLFSARTPGHPALFGEAPTPVNAFSTLLNAYLGADLPIRPDRSYLSQAEDPLRLTWVP